MLDEKILEKQSLEEFIIRMKEAGVEPKLHELSLSYIKGYLQTKAQHLLDKANNLLKPYEIMFVIKTPETKVWKKGEHGIYTIPISGYKSPGVVLEVIEDQILFQHILGKETEEKWLPGYQVVYVEEKQYQKRVEEIRKNKGV